MRTIYIILKRIIFAFGLIYGFNMIMQRIDMFIPLNEFTIGTISFLGFPGLFLIVGLINFI